MADHLYKLKISFYSGKENPFVILTLQEQREIILLLKKQKYFDNTEFIPELGHVGFNITDGNIDYEVYLSNTSLSKASGNRLVSKTNSVIFKKLILLFLQKYEGSDKDFIKKVLDDYL